MTKDSAIIQAIQNYTEGSIFKRGEDYFLRGRVKTYAIEQTNSSLLVCGKVRGTKTYDVTIEMNKDLGEIIKASCSCPYGLGCKHAVALAFTVSKLEMGIQGPEDTHQDTKKLTEVVQNLRASGFEIDRIPTSLIKQLLQYQKTNKITLTTKKFNPAAFFISLSRYDGFRPTLYQKQPYQQASIKKLLLLPDLSEAQRQLFAYMLAENFANFKCKPPDLATLFPMLARSGFELSEGYYHDSNGLRIELNPEPLKAQIIYDQHELYGQPGTVRHDFLFRMPTGYWQNYRKWSETPFIKAGTSIIHEENKVISLYTLTPMVADLIARAEPIYDYSRRDRVMLYAQTKLNGNEVTQYEKLIKEARQLLHLETEPPGFTTQSWNQKDPAVYVLFDANKRMLRMEPNINYGADRVNVSETMYTAHRRADNELRRRQPFAHPGKHIIRVQDDVIHHAPVDETKEKEFYQTLQSDHEKLGFTKTLKSLHKGKKRVNDFLLNHWPYLLEHAKSHGYTIHCTHDELPRAQAAFHADVDLRMNEKEDWLYFDVTCYCGDEQIPLQALLDYLAGRTAFIRRSDGSLVEVKNKHELERFASMLQSFHAREEGGFEGAPHHAPELHYLVTNSEYYNATQSKAFKEFQKRLYAGKPIRAVRLKKRQEDLLRDYQKGGIQWLYFLRSFHFGGVLADEMGLGKTFQALVVIEKERTQGMPSLVVCPKTLLYNWQAEAQMFCPGLKVLLYEGSPSQRRAKRKQFTSCDLVVTGYATLQTDEMFLTKKGLRFNYAILDEAQAIKNPATKTSQAVKKIHAEYRLALTGTPLENNVLELWSIFDFLMPGFLGSHKEFITKFSKPIMEDGNREVAEHLRRKIACFMLRRTKKQVLNELPPKIEQLGLCHLSDAQNILYQQILAKTRENVLQAVEEKGFNQSQIHILSALTKLRQACNHPALLLKEKKWNAYESTKLDSCLERVDEVAQSGGKVLIFSQFTSMLDILREALDEKNVHYSYLSGKTKDRKRVVEAFKADPTIPVFLISLKAGGVGLNLTCADTVIIFDPWWNPSVENQAIDRTHRIGQDKPVHVHRLITTGTIEEKIQKLKEKKQGLFDAMVGESKDLLKKLTWADVRELFEI